MPRPVLVHYLTPAQQQAILHTAKIQGRQWRRYMRTLWAKAEGRDITQFTPIEQALISLRPRGFAWLETYVLPSEQSQDTCPYDKQAVLTTLFQPVESYAKLCRLLTKGVTEDDHMRAATAWRAAKSALDFAYRWAREMEIGLSAQMISREPELEALCKELR